MSAGGGHSCRSPGCRCKPRGSASFCQFCEARLPGAVRRALRSAGMSRDRAAIARAVARAAQHLEPRR